MLAKEREVHSIFAECDARALNYLINHVKMGLLFYKIKDHQRFFSRTELIQLLAVDRLPALTVVSRVIILHALQLMKLRSNPRAEYWVRNIILSTNQDDLSELKTLMDSKGDYFCMTKLLYSDIKSQTIRHDILTHISREAAVQQAHMQMGTRKGRRRMYASSWRKILSDVDDTLTSSGGSYPAGIDRRYSKKVVYPGVLAFYRELDLGTNGPEEWPDNRVGNLVFLSARPHVYKDVSEKINFAKFEKLRIDVDGRRRLHTVPSLLAGDLASGTEYVMTNDMEPLALKKYDNFQRYVSIYPEYKHVFVCDNGQGDVRAGEMMFDAHPYEFEALYVHVVQDIDKTHGYDPAGWKEKGFEPCFFRTYPEAALDAVKRDPPLIRKSGLQRICIDTVKDFHLIRPKQWSSHRRKTKRRAELNQGIWKANEYLKENGLEEVPYIDSPRAWEDGVRVRTPYGIGIVRGFDPRWNLYKIELDWRPVSVQVEDHLKREKEGRTLNGRNRAGGLETVLEIAEHEDDDDDDEKNTSDSGGGSGGEDDDATDLLEVSRQGGSESGLMAGLDDTFDDDSEKHIPSLIGGHATAVSTASSLSFSSTNTTATDTSTSAAIVDSEDVVDSTSSTSTTASSISTPKDSNDDDTSDMDKILGGTTASNSSGSVATSTESQTAEKPKSKSESKQRRTEVLATIHARDITKYTPPAPPKLSKDRTGTLFSFWGTEKKPDLSAGDRCLTPYGP